MATASADRSGSLGRDRTVEAALASALNGRQTADPLLRVHDLRVAFATRGGTLRAVAGIDFEVGRAERLAVVGESGSGKSVTALAVMQLLDSRIARVGGTIEFDGRDLRGLGEREMLQIRGAEISLIFQDPLSALNPLKPIGAQIRESLLVHRKATKDRANEIALELLAQVEMPDPQAQFRQRPHELSGGMNQRAMIAMALACEPKLLIADEPTTALDATTQAQIVSLLKRLAVERQMSVMLITHDLGLVAGFAKRVLIMYSGKVVEDASAHDFFKNPCNPYSHALLASTPRVGADIRSIPGRIPDPHRRPSGCVFHPRCALRQGRDLCVTDVPPLRIVNPATVQRSACHFAEELETHRDLYADPNNAPAVRAAPHDHVVLEVEDLVKEFDVRTSFFGRSRRFRAVDDVSFTIRAGETLALVGESGSGKSTTARLVLGLETPTAGSIRFEGQELTQARAATLRRARKDLGIVFQDPTSSLDPKMTAAEIIAEPMVLHGDENATARRERVKHLMSAVGVEPERALNRPSAFSGGERQRIAIARALSLRPKLIVCDEPTTMLDVSVQAQILNLLREVQAATSVAFLFIAHDLAVVRHVADTVAVMYGGKIVESAANDDLFRAPNHAYTKKLLAAGFVGSTVDAANGGGGAA